MSTTVIPEDTLSQAVTPTTACDSVSILATEDNPNTVLLNEITTIAPRTNLLGMTRAQLEAFFMTMGDKKFRAQQVMRWIHQFGVTQFDDMTDISKPLREKLKQICCITAPEVVSREYSADGTRKWVMRVGNDAGSLIETVLIPADTSTGGRKTLCVSSQVGCALDCSFCSTGKQGFQRDLTAAEIIGQVWIANQSYMEGVPIAERSRTVTNVVMMGMGEPLLNFEPVVAAMDMMLDDYAYGMSKRRVTLSTSGIVPMIDKLAERLDVALAISLHATNDALRDQLVPINKKYPLAMLIPAAQRYIASSNARNNSDSTRKHVTIEYVMLDGVNDSLQHAREMTVLLRDLPSKINLIPFNPFPHAPYARSSRNRIMAFQKHLSDAGFVCTIRGTRGDDIDAACGQLVGQVADRTRRARTWQKAVDDAKAGQHATSSQHKKDTVTGRGEYGVVHHHRQTAPTQAATQALTPSPEKPRRQSEIFRGRA